MLTEHGVLRPQSKDALRAMARFRNRLVHLYWDVDDQRVYEYLQEGLGDIEQFREASHGTRGESGCRGGEEASPCSTGRPTGLGPYR